MSKALVKRKQRSLARVTAAAGFFGAFVTMGVAGIVAVLAGSISVPMWTVIPFCLAVSTIGGWWFGDVAGGVLSKPQPSTLTIGPGVKSETGSG